jgi:hypothetical protein
MKLHQWEERMTNGESALLPLEVSGRHESIPVFPGGSTCTKCHERIGDHPGLKAAPWIHVLCNGVLVKEYSL